MATRDNTLYVRNGRPNTVIFTAGGVRHKLEHRGNRQDSAALSEDAAREPIVVRWLQSGQLEKISKEAFMALGARTVDTLPNEYLERSVRKTNARDLELLNAGKTSSQEQDTTGAVTHISDGDVHKTVRDRLTPKWAGELMTTDEELEDLPEVTKNQAYPSKHRDDDTRRQMGY